jgi:hypothetical protein
MILNFKNLLLITLICAEIDEKSAIVCGNLRETKKPNFLHRRFTGCVKFATITTMFCTGFQPGVFSEG